MADKRNTTPTSASDMMRSAFEPFQVMQSEMARFQNEMTRMVESFWAGAGRPGLLPGASMPAMRPAQPFAAAAIGPAMGLPASDVSETDEAYLITAELPGMDVGDVQITVADNMLTLSGEKQEETTDARASFYMSERRYGRFQRAFPLPANVDHDKIAAGFKNGVLTVTLPKTADAKRAAKTIEVKTKA